MTGVQTCALPISKVRQGSSSGKAKRKMTPEEKAAAQEEIEHARKDAQAPMRWFGLGDKAIVACQHGMLPDKEFTAATGQLLILIIHEVMKKMVHKENITAEEVTRVYRTLPVNLQQGGRQDLQVPRSHMIDAHDLQVEVMLEANLAKLKQTLNDSYTMEEYLWAIFWVLYGPYIEVADDKQKATEFRDEVAAFLDLKISKAARSDPDVRAKNFRTRMLWLETDPRLKLETDSDDVKLWRFPPRIKYKGARVIAFVQQQDEEIVPVGKLLPQEGIESRFAYVNDDGQLQGIPKHWSPRDDKVFSKLVDMVKSLDTPFTLAMDELEGASTSKEVESLPEEWFNLVQFRSAFQTILRQVETDEFNALDAAGKEKLTALIEKRKVDADAMSALVRIAVMTVFNLHLMGKDIAHHVGRKRVLKAVDYRATRKITVKVDLASGAVCPERDAGAFPVERVAHAGVLRHDLKNVMNNYATNIKDLLQKYVANLIAFGARAAGGLHYV